MFGNGLRVKLRILGFVFRDYDYADLSERLIWESLANLLNCLGSVGGLPKFSGQTHLPTLSLAQAPPESRHLFRFDSRLIQALCRL